jgi:2-polyprenyl-3-methyl-5-hydroxy-6-metoxy-1,4-benzoquinol methylase
MAVSDLKDGKTTFRILVAIASYGSSNDRYLERLIREYRSMRFDVDIVIVSNIEKKPALAIECFVGLPIKNPWSLPFAHKKVFAERADRYDLFVYSEDDILITEGHLRALLDVTSVLPQNEIVGFLRVEKGANGEQSYPDFHACFHWDPTSVRSRGKYTVAHFTNEHAACYILTQAQLGIAIRSGGFLVDPHEEKYDLLCTAATDPYTQCGFKKVIPVSHIDKFIVHHLSNKYAGKVGVSASELKEQLAALARIAERKEKALSLFETETKLPRAQYSKDYYEPANEKLISAITKTARSVLSIGSGWGATERQLVEQGLRVVAIPLDPVISSGAAACGVEMMYGDIDQIAALTRGEKFDCVLCLNVLHLAPDPAVVLSKLRGCLSDNSAVIIQIPNMMSLRSIRAALKDPSVFRFVRDYSSSGVHFSSVRSVRDWSAKSGMKIEQTTGIFDRPEDGALGKLTAAIGGFLPTSLTIFLATSIIISVKRLQDEYGQLAWAEPLTTQPEPVAAPERIGTSTWRTAPRTLENR